MAGTQLGEHNLLDATSDGEGIFYSSRKPPQHNWKKIAVIGMFVAGLVWATSTGLSSRGSVQEAAFTKLIGAFDRECWNQAGDEYNTRKENCRATYEASLTTCLQGDRQCRNEVLYSRRTCDSKAWNCKNAVYKNCQEKEPKEIEDLDECRPEACVQTARDHFQAMFAECTTNHTHWEKKHCPEGKKRARCLNELIHWFNACTRHSSECQHALFDKCKKNVVADPATMEQCQPWAQYPIDVVKGADITPATKQLYQFRAVGRSCFYGSDWCDQAIVDDNRGLRLGLPSCRADLKNATGQCLEKELALKGYYLTEAETAGEFYIGREHHTEGKSPLLISLTDEECPVAQTYESGKLWKEYKCRLLELHEAGKGAPVKPVPWMFEKVQDSPDQFTITTSMGCPGGEHCGWQLSVDELPCPRTGTRTPMGLITLESNLTHSVHWRMLPTPIKAESLSHLAGLPVGAIAEYLKTPPPPCEDGRTSSCQSWAKKGWCSYSWMTDDTSPYQCKKSCNLC